MNGFWGTFIRSSLALFFLGIYPLQAQEDLSPPTNVSLKYEETRVIEEVKCESGSILAAVDCVAIRIENSGGTGEITSVAALGLTLSPVLRPENNFSVVNVYVRTAGGPPVLTQDFADQPGAEAKADSDTRLLKERLKRWSARLDEDQIEELLTEGQTEVEIARPFKGLKILELENPPAILTLIMPVRVAQKAEGAKEGETY